MLEVAGVLVGGLLLDQRELSAVVWFGAGLVLGLVLAIASLAACALGCLGQERVLS